MRNKRTTIESLAFQRPDGRRLGFEVFTLASLYERAERIGFDLVGPKRMEFDMILVGTRGRGRIIVDFTPVPLGEGWLTFLAHGRVRQFEIDRRTDGWMLLFEPERIGASPVLSPTWVEPALAVPVAQRPRFEALVGELVAEHDRVSDERQPAILDHLLRTVLLQAERLHLGDNAPVPDVLTRFFDVLERDHARTRSVAHYAKATGISQRRLGELLGAHLGKTAKLVIDERVVLECKRRLAHTDISVKELAEQLGFDEPTNLVKFFRRHTQTTPIAFREAQHTTMRRARPRP